jgi:DNA-binding MarR family transcriptional regulator
MPHLLEEIACHGTRVQRAARRILSHYDDALKPLGVNIGQFTIVRMVARYQPISHTDLAIGLELDRSTIGRKTKVLLRRGLIAVTEGDDRRESLLFLTAKGKDLLAKGTPLWATADQHIGNKLGPDRAAQLNELLSSL